MAEIFLICNAHIDPVWQWDWNEGAAVALSTFRAAADFCEENESFVFCHNEAMLYQWVEQYEPPLFERIRRLVARGKWHIMGGWYLQPDCNLPSGESIFRQIESGRRYFYDKFGVLPSVAVSFDAFGHDRGLVQILRQCGYTSYLFMRPADSDFPYPGAAFRWRGYNGSEVLAWHIDCGYHSDPGTARKKIERFISAHPGLTPMLIPWGVGNHGGGPSRADIRDVNALMVETGEHQIRHATPEAFFADLAGQRETLPAVTASLRPFAVGCYTSQIRVKQRHRLLEAMLERAGRMAADALYRCGTPWPEAPFRLAEEDLLKAEFHDILPGSGIRDAEEYALRVMDHGLEILDRIQTEAFFRLAANESRALPGETAVLVWNPWPFPLETVVETEFMLEDAEERHGYFEAAIHQGGAVLPTQVIKERSNMAWEWRKRVAFRAVLQPLQMNRFDIHVTNVAAPPEIDRHSFVFDSDDLHAEVDPSTGLLSSYRVGGIETLSAPAGKLVLYQDSPDSWGMTVDRFADRIGEFRLMTPEESARLAGTGETAIPPVRVIEDGPVLRAVEACFVYGGSTAICTWSFPRKGTEIGLKLQIHLAERNVAVKLHIPTVLTGECLGQGMFGMEALPGDGRENVAQSWIAAGDGKTLLTLINDGPGGSSFLRGELCQTLLRSCGYAAHPRGENPILRPGRYSDAQEQGERIFRFRMNAGVKEDRLSRVSREAAVFAIPPYTLSCFPGGEGKTAKEPLVRLESGSVLMTRLDRDPGCPGCFRVRLHESAGQGDQAVLFLPEGKGVYSAFLEPFEIRTLSLDPRTGSVKVIPPTEIQRLNE